MTRPRSIPLAVFDDAHGVVACVGRPAAVEATAGIGSGLYLGVFVGASAQHCSTGGGTGGSGGGAEEVATGEGWRRAAGHAWLGASVAAR